MSEKFCFNYKRKKICLSIKRTNYFTKGIGLMFRTKNTSALIFKFKKPTRISIHSYFVFFPFIAIWLDKSNKILETKLVKPFTFIVKPKKRYVTLVEIPINNKNRHIIDIFRRKNRKV